MIRRIALGSLVAFMLLLIVAMSTFWWLARGGMPRRSGKASVAGLTSPVTVRFNDWGVPHVAAQSTADMATAVGYVHANDRLVQLELGRRLAAGRLAEVLGRVALPSDRYFRSLGMRRHATVMLEAASPETRMLLEAYARGVNAWLQERGSDLPPELRLLGVDPAPWKPIDSFYFQLQMAHELSFWQGRPEEDRYQWLRAYGRERLADLLDEPNLQAADSIVALARQEMLQGVMSPIATPFGRSDFSAKPLFGSPGSNSWAIGGSRTASGFPLVANDPHLPLSLPGFWYQVVLQAPDYESAGMTLPGFPFVVIGHGEQLAWALTNVMLDDHDIFFEHVSADGSRVQRDDGWALLETTEEHIVVANADPLKLTVRYSDIGVVLEADPERGLPARSMAWTGGAPADPAATFLRLARAGSVNDLIGQLDTYVAPAQNLVVADRENGLLYTAIGRVPARRSGDGRLPAPAWDRQYRWSGLLPQAANPTMLRPAADLIVTANHDIRPGTESLHSAHFTADFDTPHRAMRIHELLGQRDQWTANDMQSLQADIYSRYALELVPLLRDHYTGDAARAYEVLAVWDGAMTMSGAGALFLILDRELTTAIFDDEARAYQLRRIGGRAELLRALRNDLSSEWFDDVSTLEHEMRHDVVTTALERSWQEATRRWGTELDTWDYAELHYLRLRNPAGSVPIIGGWFNRGPIPLPGSATTVAAFGGFWLDGDQHVSYGPSMRWVADLDDPDHSLAGLPAGQSGHPADRHYDDQLANYLAGTLRPVHWSETAIAANTVSTLTLQPAENEAFLTTSRPSSSAQSARRNTKLAKPLRRALETAQCALTQRSMIAASACQESQAHRAESTPTHRQIAATVAGWPEALGRTD